MSTKQTQLINTNSCLSKAYPEEPVFVLRANDPCFAQTVRMWAAMAVGLHEPEKVTEALAIASMGEQWRNDRQPKPIAPQGGGLAGYAGGAGADVAQNRLLGSQRNPF